MYFALPKAECHFSEVIPAVKQVKLFIVVKIPKEVDRAEMNKKVQFLTRFVNHCLMVEYNCRQDITDVVIIGSSSSFRIVYPTVSFDNIRSCGQFVERVATAAASYIAGSATKYTHGFPSMGLEDLFIGTLDENVKWRFIADIGLYRPNTQLSIIPHCVPHYSCTLVDNEPILLSELNKFPCSDSAELVSGTMITYSQ